MEKRKKKNLAWSRSKKQKGNEARVEKYVFKPGLQDYTEK